MAHVKIFSWSECPFCECFLFRFTTEVSGGIECGEVTILCLGLWVMGGVERSVCDGGEQRRGGWLVDNGARSTTNVLKHHKTA